jgi:hypothetical protein
VETHLYVSRNHICEIQTQNHARGMMEEGGREHNFSDNSLPDIAGVPLVLDDRLMEDENEELGDVEGDLERYRSRVAARTVFHQPRGDNDTM